MTISLLTGVILNSTNVVDPHDEFDNTIHRNFTSDVVIKQGDSLYQNVGGLIEIPLLSSYTDADAQLKMGDIVYDDVTDNVIKKVTSTGSRQVPKQPEDYVAVPDTTKLSGSWTKRYVKLFDNFPTVNSYVVETRTHTFTLDTDAGLIEQEVDSYGSFKSAYHEQIDNSTLEWYTKVSATNNWRYHFNTFILRGTVLYGIADIKQPIEYDDVTTVQLTPIVNITNIDGFTLLKATLPYAPFDKKNYSVATAFESMTYTVESTGDFDTLALGDVVADSVSVVFKNAAGGTVSTISGYTIQNHRDVAPHRLEAYKTTTILYASADIGEGGTAEITLTSTGDISLGTIELGLSVDGGFTNLAFSNKFDDYSPYEKNQWGFITYIDGVRVQVHNGTVDVPITSYDMMNRLMLSIGGNTVILNGSDSTDNAVPDSETVFSSTQLIGRIQNFELKTKIKGMDMDKLATYSFLLEEQV